MLRSKKWNVAREPSREAAKEYSPRRKPWVQIVIKRKPAPEGRKKTPAVPANPPMLSAKLRTKINAARTSHPSRIVS